MQRSRTAQTSETPRAALHLVASVPLRWSGAVFNVADQFRVAGFVFGALGLSVALAYCVVEPYLLRFIFLFAGLLATAFVFRFPIVMTLVFFAITDFIFFPTFFTYQIGPVGIRPQELALTGLLVVALFRPQRREWGGFAGGALAVFFAMVALSILAALTKGSVSLTDAFNWSRQLFPLTLFYVIVRLFPSPEHRRVLLLGAAVLAAITGVISLLVSLGASFGSALQNPGEQAVKAEHGVGSIERVRLPGLSAGYALFWYCVVQIARRNSTRIGWVALLGGITLDVVISFNRNMWLGLVIGLLLMTIIGGTVVRNRIVTAMAVLAVAVTLFVVFNSSASSDHVVTPILDRGATILNPDTTSQEGSLQDRTKETEKAWATAQSHLLLGVGAGASFGVVINRVTRSGDSVQEAQLFLHNQYLYLLLISGIPGLLAFILFLATPVSLAWRRWPRDPAIVACGVGIALIMISAIVAIYFTVGDMTAILGLLAGVIVADSNGPALRGEPAGLMP